MKSRSLGDVSNLMFIAALFTIVKMWKQYKYTSVDEQRKKMSSTYNWIQFGLKKSQILQHGGNMETLCKVK